MYGLIFRLFVVRLSPEAAHRFAVRFFAFAAPVLRLARTVGLFPRPHAAGATQVFGRSLNGPLGLAAGMDKNARAIRGFAATGFSHVEIGTVTAQPQPGNPTPRSWRERDIKALRNQMGFNNDGADAVARRLAALRRTSRGRELVVGVNIGKTKVTAPENAPADYAYSARALAPYADYLVINVSSPNTPGLRDLQAVESLRPIVAAVRQASQAAGAPRLPLLVKISPDLDDVGIDAIADFAGEAQLDGVVAVNTTIDHDRGPGGLSGPPLTQRAREVVRRLRERMGPDPVIIGVGGITTLHDARELLAAGATLLQGYTAFVYGGPWWPARLNRTLTAPRH